MAQKTKKRAKLTRRSPNSTSTVTIAQVILCSSLILAKDIPKLTIKQFAKDSIDPTIKLSSQPRALAPLTKAGFRASLTTSPQETVMGVSIRYRQEDAPYNSTQFLEFSFPYNRSEANQTKLLTYTPNGPGELKLN